MNKRAAVFATLMCIAAASHADESHGAHKPFHAADAEQQAFGIAADPKKATRTIRVAMTDKMRFVPDTVEVRQDEIVKLIVTNKGRMLHELVIGTPSDLKEHAEMMRKFPGMEHDEPHMLHVRSGKSGQLAWQFNRAGEFSFACLLPGHYEAGMVGKIIVRAAKNERGRQSNMQ
ncbi:MAG TPA: cupredoxin family protein [Noviherbaspirillum sp.]